AQSYLVYLFLFQAEDGIRDFHVTGVQTCALPICHRGGGGSAARDAPLATARRRRVGLARAGADVGGDATGAPRCGDLAPGAPEKIGRAACKERRKVWVGGGQCKTTRVRRVSAST